MRKRFGEEEQRSDANVCRAKFATTTWPVGQAVKTEASHASNVGSIPARVTSFALHAPLAQLVEHLTLNQGVQGSSP